MEDISFKAIDPEDPEYLDFILRGRAPSLHSWGWNSTVRQIGLWRLLHDFSGRKAGDRQEPEGKEPRGE